MRLAAAVLLLPLGFACTGGSSDSLVDSQLRDPEPRETPDAAQAGSSSGAPVDDPKCASVTGTVEGTGSSGLRIRTKPNTDSNENGRVEEGATITIYCQVEGEAIEGNSVWSYLGAERGYVADAYVDTGHEGFVPDLPRCDADTLTCGAVVTNPKPEPGVDTPPSPLGSSPEVDITGPAVLDHVQGFANDACAVIGACTVSTYEGHSPSAELALDFLTSDEYGEHPTDDYAFGDRLAAYAIANMPGYRIEYVIYRQRIDMGDGWDAMDDRGSITENHYDHVHVTFEP